jgi:hypothetical protein
MVNVPTFIFFANKKYDFSVNLLIMFIDEWFRNFL